MANSEQAVITAITDVTQENFITSALTRLGYQVVYRATSSVALENYLQTQPEALILHSRDFRLLRQGGGEHRYLAIGDEISNESQLLKVLRGKNEHERSGSALDFQKLEDLTAFASTRSHLGLTTLAINFAHHRASLGCKVLLIDANFQSPNLSQRYGFNGLWREERFTKFGFAVAEINSFDSLISTANLASNFGEVIIDLGVAKFGDIARFNRRIEEVTLLWALHSAQQLFVLSSPTDINQINEISNSTSTLAPTIKVRPIIQPMKAIAPRERGKALDLVRAETRLTAALLPYDRKLVDSLELGKKSLLIHGAKSSLNLEIAALADRSTAS
jgi:hypothetical protein